MEWRLGWAALQSVAEGLANDPQDEVADAIAGHFLKDVGPFGQFGTDYTAHLACFTETPDLETTLMHFARQSKPHAIRFEVETQIAAMLAAGENLKVGVKLWPVCYSLDHLIDVAYCIGNEACRLAWERISEDSVRIETAAQSAYWELRTPFAYMALSFKRPKYQMEGEWRLISSHFGDIGLEIPWIDLPFPDVGLDPPTSKGGRPIDVPFPDWRLDLPASEGWPHG